MMDKIRPQNWYQFLIFIGITSAALGFLMSMAQTYSPKVSSDLFSSPVGSFVSRFVDLPYMLGLQIQSPYNAATRTIILKIDETVELERVWITYRGLEGDHTFRMDTIVPNLDREVAYRHQFDARRAIKGFRLYLDQFELIDAKADRLKLRYVSGYPPE